MPSQDNNDASLAACINCFRIPYLPMGIYRLIITLGPSYFVLITAITALITLSHALLISNISITS